MSSPNHTAVDEEQGVRACKMTADLTPLRIREFRDSSDKT